MDLQNCWALDIKYTTSGTAKLMPGSRFRSSIFRRFIGILWKSYIVLSCIVGSIILVPLFFFLADSIIHPFRKYCFPNGSYVEIHKFFPFDHDILLLHPDGHALADAPIDMVCFNDRFVLVWPMKGPNFIYEKGSDKVVYNHGARYAAMRIRSNLYKPRGGCDGHVKTHAGPLLLYRDHWELGRCRPDRNS